MKDTTEETVDRAQIAAIVEAIATVAAERSVDINRKATLEALAEAAREVVAETAD